ncbi:MAG TPA: phosphoribosyltransferase family protein [Chitinophagaceae bacterium]|nr:phosphoribosyltransferase family protein [Chitinophagaceae bacterium]
MATRKYIMDGSTATKKIQRLAYEILENNTEEKAIILAGIRENGVVIAKHIQQYLNEISNINTELITIYLDKKNPQIVTLNRENGFDNKVIIIIDDVANSGKTMLHAMKPFLAHNPNKIQTLVLVDRTHKKFPVHPDYRGLSVATTLQEHIVVDVENNKVQGAWME